MKPICAKCKVFFRPETNGVAFEEGAPKSGAPHCNGKPANPDDWGPYKLWMGDLWKCRGCGAEIIVGTGQKPVAMRHETNYAADCAALAPILRVDDC